MTLDVLREVAHELVTHPTLGASKKLRQRSTMVADLALARLARDDTSARALLDALDAHPDTRPEVLLDPVVSAAITRATAGKDCKRHFTVAAERLAREGCWRLYPDALSFRGRAAGIWSPREDALDALFDELFDHGVANHVAVGRAVLREPTPVERQTMADACEILEQTVPGLHESVLTHTEVVAVIGPADATTTRLVDSLSWAGFPSTIFVGPKGLRDPDHAADVLFHEMTHHKHYDLRRSRALIAPGFDPHSGVEIHAHWNPDSPDEDLERHVDTNRWISPRALSACHVYVHLALFNTMRAVELPDRREHARTMAYRARYLTDQLIEKSDGEQGPDGRELLALFASLMTKIETVTKRW